MSDATVVALVILAGTFVLLIVCLWKYGADATLKVWGGLGALTGVALGAITSYYFTDRLNEQEVVALEAQKGETETALRSMVVQTDQLQTLLGEVGRDLQKIESGTPPTPTARRELVEGIEKRLRSADGAVEEMRRLPASIELERLRPELLQPDRRPSNP